MARYDATRDNFALHCIVTVPGSTPTAIARRWASTPNVVRVDPAVTRRFDHPLRRLVRRGLIERTGERGAYIATDAGRIANSPGEHQRLTSALRRAGLVPAEPAKEDS